MSSNQRVIRTDRIPSCYTGAYFPHLAVEMIVFSQTCYSPHYSTEIYLSALLVIVSMILVERALSEAQHLSFDCPTIHDSSVDCCVEIVVVTLTDYSLKTS